MIANLKRYYSAVAVLAIFLTVGIFTGCGNSDKKYEQKCIEAKGALGSHQYDHAVELLQEGAQNGHVQSQACLGVAYMMLHREAEGAQWIRKAAEAGDTLSQFNIALCYNHGVGVPKNGDEALFWGKKAEENGIENATLRLVFSSGPTFRY